jgi:hypothetical protein
MDRPRNRRIHAFRKPAMSTEVRGEYGLPMMEIPVQRK